MILGAVREGRVDVVRMEGMARRLGGVGRHWARRDEGGACDEAEMRMILSDWFEYGELNSLSREMAVEGLILLFEDPAISLLPVANSLKDNLAKRLKDIDKILMSEIIKPEDPGNAAVQETHPTVPQILPRTSPMQWTKALEGSSRFGPARIGTVTRGHE